jgi:hypothetical protein
MTKTKAEPCTCRFDPKTGKETKMCQFHIALTKTLINAEMARDHYRSALAVIVSKTANIEEAVGVASNALSDLRVRDVFGRDYIREA